MTRSSTAARRPANISLNAELLEAAKALGINVSRACERGLEEQVAAVRASQWLEVNRSALESSNHFVEAQGVPLARHRRF